MEYEKKLTAAYKREQKWSNDSSAMISSKMKYAPSKFDSLEKIIGQRNDEVLRLSATKNKCDSINNVLEQKIETESKSSFNKGKKDVLNQLEKKYSRPLVDLIKDGLYLSYQSDRQLFIQNQISNTKLDDLEKYAKAVKLLHEPYRESPLTTVLQELNSISGVPAVDSLKQSLSKYNEATEALRRMLNKVITETANFTADDDYAKSQLRAKCVTALQLFYFRNYDISYPYLNNIVSEVLKRKMKDANADIKDLLTRL
jgi:hypothetical protein